MKKKLFAAAALLGISLIPYFTPQAEAVAYCDSGYCVGKPSTTKCGCPPHTDRRGQTTSCGSWNNLAPGGCWYAL